MAIGSVMVFAMVAPIVAVPVAGLLESAFGTTEFSQARAGAVYFFGLLWLGVWMAMAFVPGIGFTLLGWLPLWTGAGRHRVFEKWWTAAACGAVPGMLAVAGFLAWQRHSVEMRGGEGWSWPIEVGGVVGGGAAGAVVFLMSVFLAPKPKVVPLMEIPAGNLAKPKENAVIMPPEVKAVPKVGRGKKKAEKPKWTDWGKEWQPPED